MEDMAALLRQHNRFWAALGRSELKTHLVPLAPQAAASRRAVAAFVAETALPVPQDVRLFWQTPLAHGLLRPPGQPVFDGAWLAGCDWHPLATVRAWRRLNLESSDRWQEEQKDDLPHQLTLNGAHPQFILNTFPHRGRAGVYVRTASHGLVGEAVAPTFTEFFRHWLAAGCFVRGDAAAYLHLVGPYLPLPLAPEQNRWLQFHDRHLAR